MRQISEVLNVDPETIRRCMKKLGIPRRNRSQAQLPRMKLKVTPHDLHRLYWVERKSLNQIARDFGVTAGIVRRRMRRFKIARRSISEAMIKNKRKSFSGSEVERSYLLGLRAGDIHATKSRRSIQASTTTSHLSMIDCFWKAFGRYGHIGKTAVRDAESNYKYCIYVLLDDSFNFLLHKSSRMIFKNRESFYSFLAGYSDSDGDWGLHKMGKYISRSFRLRTRDHDLLKQIKTALEGEGYHPNLGVQKASKWGKNSLFAVYVDKRKEAESLAQELLPYSKHREKIEKMKLILKARNKKYWIEIEDDVLELRKRIKDEVRRCVEDAKEKMQRRHERLPTLHK